MYSQVYIDQEWSKNVIPQTHLSFKSEDCMGWWYQSSEKDSKMFLSLEGGEEQSFSMSFFDDHDDIIKNHPLRSVTELEPNL